MSLGHQKKGDSQYFEHALYGESATTTDTICLIGTAGKVFGPPGTAVNQPVVRAMRARRVGLTTAVAAVTTPGNWTFTFYKNAAYPTPTATFTFNPTAIHEVFVGDLSNPVNLDPGDYWWCACSGPERNIILVRATIGFDLL